MGELLNRELQRDILMRLSEEYPQRLPVEKILYQSNDNSILVNLAYLDEHKLVSVTWFNGHPRVAVQAKITNRGLDFLAGDGGLTALLSVVTVKLHGETLRELMIKKVEESNEDTSIRRSVVTKLKSLPAEGVAMVATRAFELGLAATPNLATHVMQWLSRAG